MPKKSIHAQEKTIILFKIMTFLLLSCHPNMQRKISNFSSHVNTISLPFLTQSYSNFFQANANQADPYKKRTRKFTQDRAPNYGNTNPICHLPNYIPQKNTSIPQNHYNHKLSKQNKKKQNGITHHPNSPQTDYKQHSREISRIS